MIFKVTSAIGHHEVDVLDEVDQQMLFEKMTGTRNEALPVEMKTKLPDTFHNLTQLWHDGKMSFIPVVKQDDSDEFVMLKQFNPQIREVVMLAPIRGG